MKKIPTIFKRNPVNRALVLNEPNPECGWVFKGEGVATRKYDGTCVKISAEGYFKRREVKAGKTTPTGFVPEMTDSVTGKTVGWVPVGHTSEDQYHWEAYCEGMAEGTYELIGPKIQGNPEKLSFHHLMMHNDALKISDAPRDFEGLKAWLQDKDLEGLVFHHPDGRMAKIKKRDFGFKR